MKTIIPVPELMSYESKGFTQCVALKELIFVTGQAGLDVHGRVVGTDMESQARQTFRNIEFALRAAGSTLGHVLTMTCFVVDLQTNGPVFWAIRKQMMPDIGFTSASIGVAGLADPRLLLEIQCIAYRPASRG